MRHDFVTKYENYVANFVMRDEASVAFRPWRTRLSFEVRESTT